MKPHHKDTIMCTEMRNNGIEVDLQDNKINDIWVITYNPKLLMMFNLHLNVKVCLSINV